MASSLVDISTRTTSIRTVSPVMAEIPWNTTLFSLTTDGMPVCNVDLLKKLLRRVDIYEETLVSVGNITKAATDLRGFLGVKIDFVRPVTVRASTVSPPSTPSQSSFLITFLTPYRLLDIAFACLNLIPHVPRLIVPRRRPVDPLEFAPLDRLKRWPSVLFRLRRCFLEANSTADVELVTLSSPSARLVKYLVVNSANSDNSKIENNLLLAALHIVSLVGVDENSRQLLDIPDDVDDFVALLFGPDQGRSDNASNLKRVCAATRPSGRGAEDLNHIRLPLFLSLWVTPINLVCTVHLSKLRFNKQMLLTVKMVLGNDVPPLLLRIELVLWRAVLRLAQGRYGPRAAISEIISGIPWSEVEQLNEDDIVASWFDLDALPLPVDLPVNQASPIEEPTFSQESATTSQAAPTQEPRNPVSVLQPVSPGGASQLESGLGVVGPPSDGSTQPASSCIPSSIPISPPVLLDVYPSVNPTTHPAAANVPSPQVANAAASPSDQSSDESQHEPVTTEIPDLVLESQQANNDLTGEEPLRRTSSRIRDQKAATPAPLPPLTSSIGQSTRKKSAASKPTLKRSRSVDDTVVPESKRPLVISFKGLGSRDMPIDLEHLTANREPLASKHFSIKVEDQFLGPDGAPRTPSARLYTAYDADGLPHSFRPSFHFEDYNDRIGSFWDRMESGYLDGRPLHVADRDTSLFDTISYEDFVAKRETVAGTVELMQRFKAKNIIVTGCSTDSCAFDAENIRRIRALHAQVSIQDYSCPPEGPNLPSAPRTVAGTPQKLLDSVALGVGGKILNALEFPKVLRPTEATQLESDLVAWQETSGVHRSSIASSYPTADMYWSLVGTSDTVTFLHADPDGVGTGVLVKCGLKVWGIIRERQGALFSAYPAVVNPAFYLDRVTEASDFDIEAIVLRPGDMLLMRPNTFHFVVGPVPTICEGFHFYCTSTMQRSVAALTHCFVAGSFLTNIYHHPTRLILRRLLVFYFTSMFEGAVDESNPAFGHLPDVNTIDGLLDLLAVCNLAILANVLDGRTYSVPNQHEHSQASGSQVSLLRLYDRNDLTWDERLMSCHVRGIAITILRAVEDACQVFDADGGQLAGFPFAVLTLQMSSLLAYKRAAVRHHIDGVPHCSVPMLKSQLDNIVDWDADIRRHYNSSPAWLARVRHSETSLFMSAPGCSVKWTRPPCTSLHGVPGQTSDYLAIGKTDLDHRYFGIAVSHDDQLPLP